MIDENLDFETTFLSTLKYYFFLGCFRLIYTKQKIRDINKLIIENLKNFIIQ